jgi:hypothetical protein
VTAFDVRKSPLLRETEATAITWSMMGGDPTARTREVERLHPGLKRAQSFCALLIHPAGRRIRVCGTPSMPVTCGSVRSEALKQCWCVIPRPICRHSRSWT